MTECETDKIVQLSKQALSAKGPERDKILGLLYGLDWDLCEELALEAVDEMTWDLIVNESAYCE